MKLIDSCLGAKCNPSCPGKLLFIDPGAVWGQTAQTTILALSLVITVVSFGLKTTLLLHQYYLKKKQEQYLNKTESFSADKEVTLLIVNYNARNFCKTC